MEVCDVLWGFLKHLMELDDFILKSNEFIREKFCVRHYILSKFLILYKIDIIFFNHKLLMKKSSIKIVVNF